MPLAPSLVLLHVCEHEPSNSPTCFLSTWQSQRHRVDATLKVTTKADSPVFCSQILKAEIERLDLVKADKKTMDMELNEVSRDLLSPLILSL